MNRREVLKASLAAAVGAAGAGMSRSVSFAETINTVPSAAPAAQTPAVTTDTFEPNGRWTIEKANAWYAKQPWILGCNYVPTYAVNQLEMWQKSTFDPKIIDEELALMAKTGMNTVRVFVHDLLWKEEKTDFYANINTFFDLCEKHAIRVGFNFFTNGGKEPSVRGPQPLSPPKVHNGEWRQTPGKERVMHKPENWGWMEDYIMETMEYFRNDPRILFWDLFNEPYNSGDRHHTLGFLRLLWTWARRIETPIPLTSAIQGMHLTPIAVFLAENSDILSFHCYSNAKTMEKLVTLLSEFRRPLICKEWLARGSRNCTVFDILPIFKKYRVGALNWGLIPGKLQTQYPWGWDETKGEPEVWFHDLYREDHTPYDPKEIELFRKLSERKD